MPIYPRTSNQHAIKCNFSHFINYTQLKLAFIKNRIFIMKSDGLYSLTVLIWKWRKLMNNTNLPSIDTMNSIPIPILSKIFIISNSSLLYELDIERKRCITLSTTIIPMNNYGYGSGGIFLYFIGGETPHCERYHTVLMKWQALPDLNTNRRHCGVVYSVKRYIYAIKGCIEHTVEKLDIINPVLWKLIKF